MTTCQWRLAPVAYTFCLVQMAWSSVGSEYVELIDLGIPPGTTRGDARWINDAGLTLVRGASNQSYLLHPDGTYSLIESAFSSAWRLNESGHVAGKVSSGAAIRVAPDAYTIVHPDSRSTALDVSDDGRAIGEIPSPSRVFYYTPATGSHIVVGPVGVEATAGNAINDVGVAAGRATTPDGARAYTYSPDTGLVVLPSIGNANCSAEDINDAGTVVGSVGPNAARWNPNGSVELLQGGAISCTSINSAGDAIGVGLNTAFIWFPGTTQGIELNSLLSPEQAFNWHINWVNSINDHGQIVGRARYDPDGPGPSSYVYHAFLMQIPEPASSMLSLGAITLVLRRRPRAVCD